MFNAVQQAIAAVQSHRTACGHHTKCSQSDKSGLEAGLANAGAPLTALLSQRALQAAWGEVADSVGARPRVGLPD